MGEPPPLEVAAAHPNRLRSHPGLPRLLLMLFLLGLIGLYGWLRLGEGRFAAWYYGCVLLALLSAATAAFGLAGYAAIRCPARRIARWSARMCGLASAAAVFLVLYLLVQAVCWGIKTHRDAQVRRTGTHSTGDSYQSSRELGHMPRPNLEAGARLVVREDVIFDYRYHTDEHQRRIVPSPSAPTTPGTEALLFFGGSFAFGEGVNDGETLPAQVALRMPDVAVYNYAFSGYGPNHLLARLESLDTAAEVPETRATGVYVFIPNHVRRVIGSFAVISWSRHSPYYVLDPAGMPRRLGSFQGERAGLTRLYDFLHGDYLLQTLPVDFPPRPGRRAFELTAAIVARAAALFAEQFHGGKLIVMLYPETGEEGLSGRELRPYFEGKGLTVLDYTALLPGPVASYFYLPHDSHPRASAHRAVAEKLVEDLAEGRANK